jgi:hypothetical protein
MKIIDGVPLLNAIRNAQQHTAKESPPAVWAIGIARAAKKLEAEINLVNEQLAKEFDMEKMHAFDAKRMTRLSAAALKDANGAPRIENGQLSFADSKTIDDIKAELAAEFPEDVARFEEFQKRQDELLATDAKTLDTLGVIDAKLWPSLPPRLIETLLPLVRG